MALGNRELIKLFLTRLRKCQHVLKWCNLLRIFLQFVCLKERNVWTGCLWRMTSKHKPPPTYADGVSWIYDALKLADLFTTSSSLFISSFQWHSVQCSVFSTFFSIVFGHSIQHVNLLTQVRESFKKTHTPKKKWNTRWWFAGSLRCHPSLARSLLSRKPHAFCLLSDPQTLPD